MENFNPEFSDIFMRFPSTTKKILKEAKISKNRNKLLQNPTSTFDIQIFENPQKSPKINHLCHNNFKHPQTTEPLSNDFKQRE
jgi:hypothetical protein